MVALSRFSNIRTYTRRVSSCTLFGVSSSYLRQRPKNSAESGTHTHTTQPTPPNSIQQLHPPACTCIYLEGGELEERVEEVVEEMIERRESRGRVQVLEGGEELEGVHRLCVFFFCVGGWWMWM